MKKLFLTAVIAIMAVTANAQSYIGAGAQLWRDFDNNRTTFQLAPEVGYTLSDKWAVGVALNCNYNYYGRYDLKATTLAVNPYVRYTVAEFGAFKFFVDGEVACGAMSIKRDNMDSVSGSCWEIGLKPGIAFNLSKKFTLTTHLGFLGYRDYDDKFNITYYTNNFQKGFGFNLTNEIGFVSLYYNF